ncbi:PDZ domain-containing protein 9-like isoform X2 [Scyliorhinus canicula]|nr:PDZ domain-containing protein 9-like isoform X2 [Scyliorhinus canicula]XP_038677091.1 PDZ domain-containing protein 9-like isoform X2 [Scyliorhinus canicula]
MKENPEHNLGPSLKTFITKDDHGLGLVLIEHGSFLQILRIVGDSSGDNKRAANLKPGDILVKVGTKNVLGHNLRELRHLVGEIPKGTQLQLTVYRNYKDLPDNWDAQAETIHSNVSIQFGEEGEAARSSSSDEEDKGEQVKFKNFRPLSLFWHDMGTYIPPISRAWHAPKKNQTVLLIGPHIECDIVFHQAFEDDATSNHEGVPALNSMLSVQLDSASSTSSSSSPIEPQWIHRLYSPSSSGGGSPLRKSSQQHPSPHLKQPIKMERLQIQKYHGEEVETTESTTEASTLESSTSSSTESLLQNSQSTSLTSSTQSNDTDSGTSTSTEQTTKSSSSDRIVGTTQRTPGKRKILYHTGR